MPCPDNDATAVIEPPTSRDRGKQRQAPMSRIQVGVAVSIGTNLIDIPVQGTGIASTAALVNCLNGAGPLRFRRTSRYGLRA